MIQKSEGRVGGEEERRREVGCQWESPEEERRKEVGCQSDSAERRDAAVQVDQLSWRHTGVCGVAWQCVSVRADEPGGGALLQHCSSLDPGQHIHTLLPTQQPKELQQTTSLPSMHLCEPLPTPADVSAAPPGLIAPLSPRLAEEEEQEEEGLLKHEHSERFRGNRRSTVTAEKKRRRRRKSYRRKCSAHTCNVWGEESPPVKLTNHIAARVQPNARRPDSPAHRKRKMEDDEKSEPDRHQDVIQSEERSSIQKVRNKMQGGEKKRDVKTGRPAARIQRTRAEGGGHTTMMEGEEEEEEEEEEGEGGQKRRRAEEQRKDELMVKEEKTEETEQVRRSRRKTVGPPIRYLLESEELSHGPSVANHSQQGGDKVKRKLGREHQEEVEEEKEEEAEEEKEEQTQEEEEKEEEAEEDGVKPVKTKQVRRPRRKTVGPPIRYLLESEARSHGPSVANHSQQVGDKVKRKLGRENQEEVEEEKEEEAEKDGVKPVKTEQVRRPRRKTVGPPIRYLLESEARSHGLSATNHSQVMGAKVKRKLGREHQEEEDKEEEEEEEEKEEQTQEEEEKEEEAEEDGVKPVKTEQVRRPRRRTVGPPIRYLLESEELSHGPSAANRSQEGGNTVKKKLGRENQEEEEKVKEEEKEEDGVKPVKTEEMELVRRPRRKTVSPPIRYLLESEELSHGPSAANHGQVMGAKVKRKLVRLKSEHQEEEDKEEGEEEQDKKTEDTGRLRRRTVGPPIRYLLESEEQSHGRSTANHSKARGLRREHKEEEEERRGGAELTERTDSTRVESSEDGGEGEEEQLCQELNAKSDGAMKEREERSKEYEEKTLLPASTKSRDWLRLRELVHRNPRWKRQDADRWRRQQERGGGRGRKTCREEEKEEEEEVKRVTEEDGESKGERKRRDGGEEKEEEKEMLEQPQRPRRKMVGPPIRYLLESEELSRGSVERQKTLLPASTKAPDWSGCREHVHRNPRWWVDDQATMRRRQDADRWRRPQEIDGGRGRKRCREEEKEEEEEVLEQPQRPRRTMVGPPIRYLLESEEL